VLRTLLEEERRLIARGESSRVTISSDTTRSRTMASTKTDCVGCCGRGERSDPLIVGRMFLTPEDGELARIEGRLARNPSLWTSRTSPVDVVRSYRRINGALVPVSLESTAQLRLLGRSTLLVIYRYSEIDDRAIHDE